MPRRVRKKGLAAGANPHHLALHFLSRLVLGDPDFKRLRASIHRRFPVLRELQLGSLLTQYKMMRDVARPGSGYAVALLAVREASGRFRYDEIEDGEWVFFQMLMTGETPMLYGVGGDPSFEWRPTVFIPPGEDFESVLRQIRRLLVSIWPEVEGSREDRTWAESMPIDDLEKYAEWFYLVKIKKKSVERLTIDAGPSDRTIRRGISRAQRLLGIRTKRGPQR